MRYLVSCLALVAASVLALTAIAQPPEKDVKKGDSKRAEMRERMLKEFDANKDGTLDDDERTKAREKMRDKRGARGDKKSGKRRTAGARGPEGRRGPHPPNPAEMFDKFDKDKDGKLSKDEFMEMAKAVHEHMRQAAGPGRQSGAQFDVRRPRGPSGNARFEGRGREDRAFADRHERHRYKRERFAGPPDRRYYEREWYNRGPDRNRYERDRFAGPPPRYGSDRERLASRTEHPPFNDGRHQHPPFEPRLAERFDGPPHRHSFDGARWNDRDEKGAPPRDRGGDERHRQWRHEGRDGDHVPHAEREQGRRHRRPEGLSQREGPRQDRPPHPPGPGADKPHSPGPPDEKADKDKGDPKPESAI